MSQRSYRYSCFFYKSNSSKMITLDISSSLEWLNPEKVSKAIKDGIAIWVIKLQGTARKEAPIFEWFLRNKIQINRLDNGWTQELNSGAEYSYSIHEWRRPWTMPNVWALQKWADKKGIGIPWYVLARSIMRKWTKWNPFFTRTVELEEDNILAILQNKIKEALW